MRSSNCESPQVIELFTKYGVLSERELESRLEIYLEQYCKTVRVEAAANSGNGQDVDLPGRDPLPERAGLYLREPEAAWLRVRHRHARPDDRAGQVPAATAFASWRKRWRIDGAGGLQAEAAHYCELVLPAMASVRTYADELEGWVADDLWPLPTYQEMLFIK